jgi:hypothetical protein
MDSKKWYTSWTLWFNGLVAAGVTFANSVGQPIPEELVAAILTIGNAALRFKTKGPVTK